jgi:pimeloyl-ACP methyl ester carboxylesterase/class 3 adenylate cyclase
MGDTAYATCGDLSLAYQVFGEGDIELVIAGSFVSHVEMWWTVPETKAFSDALGSFCRVLLFDKAGVGLSDPVPKVRTIDDRAAELEAVMDAAGFTRSVILGVSEGGPAAIAFAASRPDRVRQLILTGTFAYTGGVWEQMSQGAETVTNLINERIGAKYAVSTRQTERALEFANAVRSKWGTGEALHALIPSVASMRQLGVVERSSASPGMARATLESAYRIDVRPLLPAIRVPALVVHAVDDPVPLQFGRYLADHIENSEIVEIEGADHAPWFSHPDRFVSIIEQFVTGAHRDARQSQRALRSVLFTDIVASTERAAALGDQRWRAVLERFAEVTGEAVERWGGRLVKSTGDGHLATFDRPSQAVGCAEALRDDARGLGIEIRAGVHAGECELIGEDIGGIAVHIAARVLSHAAPSEILVTSSIRDLVVGSGIGFIDRGTHELKGVPGEWHLLEVDPGGAQPGSAEAELVALPTPATSTAMRRSDRAVLAVARRSPRVIRGLARLSAAVTSSST